MILLGNPAAAKAWVERPGFVAAFCTTTAFAPQLLRVYRLESAREISPGTFLIFSAGVFLWLIYGMYTALWNLHSVQGIYSVQGINSVWAGDRVECCDVGRFRDDPLSESKYDRSAVKELKR